MMKYFTAFRTKCFSALLAAALIFAAGACSRGSAPPPNLLIIVSDALRADVIGCYGGEARTPNIDRLAAGGTRFEHCYATAPWTWPSAVSMFTGNYPTAYRATDEVLFPHKRPAPPPVTVFYVPGEEQLFGERLRSAGYDVRMAMQNPLPGRSNSLQGFEPLEPSVLTPERREAVQLVAGRDRRQSQPLLAMLDYLLNAPDHRPFCLLGWVLDPHGEYDPPARFKRGIDPGEPPLPHPLSYYAKLNSRQLKNVSGELSVAERAYIRALYLAEVAYVDQRVGRIIAALEHRGLLESTLIVFTSDHGEAFWEHGHSSHGNTYFEEMVRVPLIFSGPGIPAGGTIDTPASHLDLAPTMAELIGIELDADVQGASYAGFFQGKAVAPGPIGLAGAHPQLQADALVEEGYKLIRGAGGALSLYRLDDDPGERADLAVEMPELAERMARRLDAMQAVNRLLSEGRPVPEAVDPYDRDVLAEQMKALGYVE